MTISASRRSIETKVYSSNITVSDALARAYTLGSADNYQDAALLLQGHILRAFRESKALPWPPTANDMELSADKLLPPELIRFLSIVTTGKEDGGSNKKTKHLISSIAQDLWTVVS